MKTAYLLALLSLAADEPNCDGNLPRAPAGEHGVDRNGVGYDNPTPTSADETPTVTISVGTGGVGVNATVPLTPPPAAAPPP